ncbi:hypothetical protein JOE48_006168 [Methylobacterium sp. PvR107]|nr:hypothetical protein [Methylobacterium sp. PvR107]
MFTTVVTDALTKTIYLKIKTGNHMPFKYKIQCVFS